MHLAGLDDHYRDCRPNRIALGVDNCKDGDTCTAAQKAAGICPSCPGYEDDVMGTDVTKPIDCNRDIVEVIRLANNPFGPFNPSFICSDSCCEKVYRTTGNNMEKIHNEFFVGFSLIREDNGSNGFYTYGGQFSYTRDLCWRGGITGDVGINFGSDGVFDYTKINILAGGTYYPIKTAVPASDFSFSVHALAGISSIRSSYSGNSNSNSNLTLDLGVGANYYFGQKLGLGLKAGYMPSFDKGNTSNNFRLGLGIDFR
jgi:hypothetical protein